VRPDSVLVIDVGTSAMRAVLVRSDGTVLPLATEAHHLLTPDEAAPFGHEFDQMELRSSLFRLIGAGGAHRSRLAAITITGQREAVVFSDGEGHPLFASPNQDARAAGQGMAIDAARSAEVYAVTGHLPSLLQIPAKLAWLGAERPQVASKVRWVTPLVDWCAGALAGTVACSRSLAAENGLLDVSAGTLPDAYLRSLGLDPALVPPITADGTLDSVAGLPVILAGADTQCALVGLGATEPGSVGVAAGWSAPLQMATARAIIDTERRTWTSVHVVPGTWILESNVGETGGVWEWICAMMRVSGDEADALAAAAPVGSHDVSVLAGARRMRASELNASMGAMTFPLPLAVSDAGRGEVLRATLEGIACAIRANLEQLEFVSGAHVGGLELGGGMSRSALFARIVADVIDRPVRVAAHPETSAVGAAALAAVSAGLHPSLDEAVAAMCGRGQTIRPILATSAEYEDVYGRWCALADEIEHLTTEAG
jgi:sugar (pentulose or hexulose) kinase